ncbi:MAG: response regulator [Candidatus Gastranaerophilales bacterium]|nr:response regulator [Candidatus Gastranaerophilales bacterium]
MSEKNTMLDNSTKKRAKLLCVDDQPDILEMYKFALEELGPYECILAHNGYEALEILTKRADIDLILTDIEMPILRGDQLINELEQKNISLKTIVISDSYLKKGLHEKENVFAILDKPLTSDILLNTIKEALN